jgi:hypothetical protein
VGFVVAVFVVLLVIVAGLQMTGLWKALPRLRQEAVRSRGAWATLPIKLRVVAATCIAVGLALAVLLAASAHS